MKTFLMTIALAVPCVAVALDAAGATLAAGGSHSIAVKPDGTTWAWGSNTYGQLGDGTVTQRTAPVQVFNLSNVIAVSAGESFTVALKSDGTVWAWGRNDRGQLGNNSLIDSVTPVQVLGPAGSGFLSGVVALDAGGSHVLVLKGDGSVWAWGANEAGQVGDNTSTQRLTPVQVVGSVSGYLIGIVAVSAGGSHSTALKGDGSLWAWGLNLNGQLGNDTTAKQQLRPVQVKDAAGTGFLSGVAIVAAGGGGLGSHTLAVKTDGTVWAWGANASGQLGDNTTTQRLRPVQVRDSAGTGFLSGISAISAGGGHSLALRADGTGAWSWGDNDAGQLGIGTTTGQLKPVQVSGLTNVLALTAGSSHSLALENDGTIWAWGANNSGQLGDNTTTMRLTPVQTVGSGFGWTVATPSFSSGSGTYSMPQSVFATCATANATIRYTTDGSDPDTKSPVFPWIGLQIELPTTLRARAWAAGLIPSAIAQATYAFKVATPTMTPPGPGPYTTAQPVTLEATTPSAAIYYSTNGGDPTTLYTGAIVLNTYSLLRAKAVRAGWQDSDIATATYTFNYGTLPAPTMSPVSGTYVGLLSVTLQPATGTPAGAVLRYTLDETEPSTTSWPYTGPITLDASMTVKAKAFHVDYTQSPTTTGTYTIQVPTPTLTPAGGTPRPVTVNCPGCATLGATIHYTINATGDPTMADLQVAAGGTITLTGTATLKVKAFKVGCTPSGTVVGQYNAIYNNGAVGAGSVHSVALKPDGTVWTWGANNLGQLGTGDYTTQKTLPAQVPNLIEVKAIAVGANHTLALKADGTVWAWGDNLRGQRGDGTSSSNSANPVQVAGLSGITAIAAAGDHSLALQTGGSIVWAWGDNTYGQLGIGTSGGVQRTPVRAQNDTGTGDLSGILGIAAGKDHSLALATDGGVWAWGRNADGQLGDDTTTQRTRPVHVKDAAGTALLTGIKALAAGARHSLAVATDGDVWAWGSNQYGGLGVGPTPSGTNKPVQVPTPTSMFLAAAGAYQSLVTTDADGDVWAWGANWSGQVGDGTTTQADWPVAIPETTGVYDVVSLAGGDSHSLAVTVDGTVLAWGSDYYGQLGDGVSGNVNRLSPIKVSDAGFQWRVATPALNPGTGTYSSSPTVYVSCATPSATVHYTTNGTDPTPTSTPVPPNNQLTISQNMTLKAIAVKDGRTSNIATAVYELKVEKPTMSSYGGNYTAPVTVTMAVLPSDAVIHYTTDGNEPTESSPLYQYPPGVTISTTTTLKAKGFKPGWTPSDTRTAPFYMHFGPQPTPTLSPGSGTYVDQVAVTMTIDNGPSGAVIHYTTDGTNPTSSSPLYQGPAPITFAATTTLNARAFHPDYSTSPLASAIYTIRSSTPTFSPSGGTQTAGTVVTLATVTTGATIRYTIDGREPTEADPSGTSVVAGSFTLKAKAFKPGCQPSATRSAVFSVTGQLTGGDVAAGANHSVALASDGTVWAWGANGSGQLGDGSLAQRTSPVLARGLTGVTAVAAGGAHTLAIPSDGTVWAWGDNADGQIGDGTQTTRLEPQRIASFSGITAIAAGDRHSLALKSDGTVWAWGSNDSGQIGDGSPSAPRRLAPVKVVKADGSDLTGIVGIAAGGSHSLAVDGTGTVWAWGSDASGQLGNGGGSSANQYNPVTLSLNGAGAVAAGSLHSLALKTDGTLVWAWGANGSGQLGNNGQTPSPSPVTVDALTGVARVAGGASHSLAVKVDGTIWAWGANGSGQLGNPVPGQSPVPVAVANVTGAIRIAAGAGHSLALASDGTVWAWGANGSGQLGDGTTAGRTAPAPVLGLPGGGSGWLYADPDGDGLITAVELQLGTDPQNPDTNGDGLDDGAEVALGWSPTDMDMDDDGILNPAEIAQGTDPFNADTDGDGHPDGQDAFPLDPTRWELPGQTGDVTPPTITLIAPTGAVLIP